MTAVDVVCARLEAVAAVTAVVGTRIYALHLPQGVTYPAVLVRNISPMRDQHLRGRIAVERARVQVDAYAHETSGLDPLSVARAVAEAIDGDGNGPVATGLDGWIGDTAGSPSAHVFAVSRVGGPRDDYDPEELRLVRVSQDFMVHWTMN